MSGDTTSALCTIIAAKCGAISYLKADIRIHNGGHNRRISDIIM